MCPLQQRNNRFYANIDNQPLAKMVCTHFSTFPYLVLYSCRYMLLESAQSCMWNVWVYRSWLSALFLMGENAFHQWRTNQPYLATVCACGVRLVSNVCVELTQSPVIHTMATAFGVFFQCFAEPSFDVGSIRKAKNQWENNLYFTDRN